MHFSYLANSDPEIAEAISEELGRQRDSIELIASENFVSPAVMEAVGSPLTNKYAEGYPGRRFYGGCWAVDKVEQLARDRAKQLFGCAYANVQPHSGAQANYAALSALMKPGDVLMGMDLAAGGHLTHGSSANFSGKLYHVVPYGVDGQTGRIDYDALASLSEKFHPAVIIAGASAYPRSIDFERFSEIARGVGAYLMVDMAHIAGLVAVGRHPDPLPWADVVTTTTHKTLRGTRGGMILTNNEALHRKINSAVFPGTQGGPLMHVIAGKAVALGEALQPEFATYIDHVLANCQALGEGMLGYGLDLVTGGSDNHLQLVDLRPLGDVSGRQAEQALERAGITANKNTVPGERRKPTEASGLRVGTAAITTRGFGTEECHRIGELIGVVLNHLDSDEVILGVRSEVSDLLAAHPLYPSFD